MLHLFKTKPMAFMPLLLGLVEGSSTLWHRLAQALLPMPVKVQHLRPHFTFLLVFSFLRYPWHHLAASGTSHVLVCFHHFSLFPPQFCPSVTFWLSWILAWSHARL